MVTDGYKGYTINKKLANVKFCDNVAPRFSIAAVWKSVGKYVWSKQILLRTLVVIQFCNITTKSKNLYSDLMVIVSWC